MKFTLRQFGYFIAAAESGSITLASKRANISQPAISTAHFAHRARTRRAAVPASSRARLVLDARGPGAAARGEAAVEAGRGLVFGRGGHQSADARRAVDRLVLHAGPHRHAGAGTIVSQGLPRDAGSLPRGHQEGLLQSLREAEIEIAITYDLQISDDVAFVPLATLPPYALFGAAHPLAREGTVKLSQLAALPMVLLDLPMSREYFGRCSFANGWSPTLSGSSSMEVVRTMVANGLGYRSRTCGRAPISPSTAGACTACRSRAIRRPCGSVIATLKQLKKTRLVDAFQRHARSDPGMPTFPAWRRRCGRAAARGCRGVDGGAADASESASGSATTHADEGLADGIDRDRCCAAWTGRTRRCCGSTRRSA